MKITDLTHIITEHMPVYPGTDKPKLTIATTVENEGFKETILHMFSHTGTHMDAPAHMLKDAHTLDMFNVSHFIGKAFVIDCSDAGTGGTIEMHHILPYQSEADSADFLLFYTGWDVHWNGEKYFGAYPSFSEDVIRYCANGNKKGIGIDAISIDPITSHALPMHQIILGADMVILENLCNLNLITGRTFTLCALPLRYVDADGSPIRCIALED